MRRGVAVALGGLGMLLLVSLFFFRGADESATPSKKETATRRATATSEFQRKKKARAKPRLAGMRPVAGARKKASEAKSVIDDLLQEEALLTDVQRALLAEIQSVLDREDLPALVKIVQDMQSSRAWPDEIPAALHKAAISALRWFGTKAAPEIACYLACGVQEVAESAMSALEEVLSDLDQSDYERSRTLLQLSKIVSDPDELDFMYTEIVNNMRDSVKADTMIAILTESPEVAQKALQSTFELVTEMETTGSPEDMIEKIKQWKEANPDSPDDDEFYGGLK